VVHDPDVPTGGTLVAGQLPEMLDQELAVIRGLLAPGERYPARRPPVQPNTTAAVAGFSSVQGERAEALRVARFEAYWVNAADIGFRSVLHRLGCPAATGRDDAALAILLVGTERPVLPMMVLPDGKVSRGLGSLAA
jgi:hypothetical protein